VGLRDTAAAVGKGLFAEAVGSAALTVSSSTEARLRDLGASSAPADIDAFHHAVYAVPTGVAFAALERTSS